MTRWSSRIKHIIYYADNLCDVQNIINGFQYEGISMYNDKKLVNLSGVKFKLFEICTYYANLIENFDGLEDSKYDILSTYFMH